MSQMKGQDKIPEKQPNEVEIGDLPEKGFRILTVKMIQGLRKKKKMEKMQEMFTPPARFLFRFDGEIKIFPDKQKLREFSTTKPTL